MLIFTQERKNAKSQKTQNRVIFDFLIFFSGYRKYTPILDLLQNSIITFWATFWNF